MIKWFSPWLDWTSSQEKLKSHATLHLLLKKPLKWPQTVLDQRSILLHITQAPTENWPGGGNNLWTWPGWAWQPRQAFWSPWPKVKNKEHKQHVHGTGRLLWAGSLCLVIQEQAWGKRNEKKKQKKLLCSTKDNCGRVRKCRHKGGEFLLFLCDRNLS